MLGVTCGDPTAQFSGVGHLTLPQLDSSRFSKVVPSIHCWGDQLLGWLTARPPCQAINFKANESLFLPSSPFSSCFLVSTGTAREFPKAGVIIQGSRIGSTTS